MKTRKAKTVSGIQSMAGEFAPWFYVASNEKSWNVDVTYTASNAIRIKNGLPKELLASPDSHHRHRFRRSCRWFSFYSDRVAF